MEASCSFDSFYRNSSILITGGNGFVGKALVETLLRCFEVKKIYLMLRTKKGEEAGARLEKMLQDKLFNKLRTSGKLSKIQVVPANFQNDDVISKYDFETIVNEVHIVFHVLASVHFKESLQSSAETNIKFTGKVLEIAKKVKSLKTFVYVSTVFSNSNKSNVNEEIYDSQLSYQDVISIAGSTGKLEGDKSFALSFQHDFPNVYCLTKHFAEKLVHDQAAELPVAIFRLPIVCPAYKSLPGWTDNINNCTGFFVAASKGLIHAWLGDKNNPWNTAPVDYCVNALTAAAWGASEKYKNEVSPTVPIYNYIFKKNNIPFGMALDYCEEYSQTPFENSIYYNSCIKTKSLFWFSVIFFLTTTIPAALADLLRILTIKKPKYLRLSGQIRTFMIAVSPFSLRKFTFGNHNLKNLLETLKNSENFRNELDFDYENIDWVEFSKNVQPGIKQYFFNEDMNRCGELVKSYKRKKYVHLVLKNIFMMIIVNRAFWFLLDAFLILETFFKFF